MKSTTVMTTPQGASARQFAFLMFTAGIEMVSFWPRAKNSVKELASAEHNGQLQVTVLNGRGELAIALRVAGFA